MSFSWSDLTTTRTPPGKGGTAGGTTGMRSPSAEGLAGGGAAGMQGAAPENRPIEPGGGSWFGSGVMRWVLFSAIVCYVALSYYHGPILSKLGGYLVVTQKLERADCIVCLSGRPVERAMETADLYREKMAPRVIVTREEPPDGLEMLEARGVHYPESRDVVCALLRDLGVPVSACVTSDREAEGTIGEASVVRALALKHGYRSLILVTSPTHTRRALLTFHKVFRDDRISIMMAASRYSRFTADGWWHTRKYVREVIFEYLKLVYYRLKY